MKVKLNSPANHRKSRANKKTLSKTDAGAAYASSPRPSPPSELDTPTNSPLVAKEKQTLGWLFDSIAGSLQ